MNTLIRLLLILFALVGVALLLPNFHLVTFQYYIGSVEIHLAFLLLATLWLGALLGVLAGLSLKSRSSAPRRNNPG